MYDTLNRVTQRSFTAPANLPNYQATPNVIFTYDDPLITNSKGKLTKVTAAATGNNQLAETRYNSFDILGRVLSQSQIADGQTYDSGYSYDLSGALIEQTYPSGRVVRNTLDADGDLMQVQSTKANDTLRNYANGFTYTAAGAVSAMTLGNGKWESTLFNSRLQPTRIGLGGSASDQSLLKLDYTYGTVVNGQLDTTKNNGNIQSQTITVPTVGSSNGFTAVQTYTYDSLNRIDDATEKIGSTEIWKQDYTFDRYGNRNFDEANTTTIARNCLDNQTPPNPVICDVDRKMMNPSVNAANNRLSSADGYQFDVAGNTIRDPQNRKFTYDAENKETKVETVDANGTVTGTLGQYSYDGDGRRSKDRLDKRPVGNNRFRLRRIIKIGGRILDKSKPSPAGRVPDQRPPRQPAHKHQRKRRRGRKTRLPTFW
ncbi:MAG: hypothetical protein IPK58_19170 [Acidobacteria bacterium]|nr:hypothetical protein [Acidobacteriota bacterium]